MSLVLSLTLPNEDYILLQSPNFNEFPQVPFQIFLGGFAYQIKGCAGKGGFAQVFKAYFDSNPDEVVALKVIIVILLDISLNEVGLTTGSCFIFPCTP